MAPSSGTASTSGWRSREGAGEGDLVVGAPGAARCLPADSPASPRCLSSPRCRLCPSLSGCGSRQLSHFPGVTPPAPRVRRCLSKDGETEARHPPGQPAAEAGCDGGCWGPGRALQAAQGERGGDPAHGQGDVPPSREASHGRQRWGHVASQPKPPWGSKEGKCFMELEKKKSFANRPQRCQLLRPALRQREAPGVACSPQPRSRHTAGTAAMGVTGLEQCPRPSASPTPDAGGPSLGAAGM